MKEYVLGFAFDENEYYVALIEKKRPKWQAGKLNGIGGHLEKGETTVSAMVREFKEETGYETIEAQWIEFTRMKFPEIIVHCFYTHLPIKVIIKGLKTITDERIISTAVIDVPARNFFILNLKWLIPMAMVHQKEPYMRIDTIHLKDIQATSPVNLPSWVD